MKELNDLKKACDIAAVEADKLIKKSQMSLFDTHHAAYDRTNASGTVSHIQQKGTLTAEQHRGLAKQAKTSLGTDTPKAKWHKNQARKLEIESNEQKGSSKYQAGDTVIHHGKKQTLVRRNDANGMARWELSNSGLMYEGDEDKHIPTPRGAINPESPDYVHVPPESAKPAGKKQGVKPLSNLDKMTDDQLDNTMREYGRARGGAPEPHPLDGHISQLVAEKTRRAMRSA